MKYQLYCGAINQCRRFVVDKHEGVHARQIRSMKPVSEVYKPDAILVKVKNGGYIEKEKFQSLLSKIKAKNYVMEYGYYIDDFMMPSVPYKEGCLYVDEDSLQSYGYIR